MNSEETLAAVQSNITTIVTSIYALRTTLASPRRVLAPSFKAKELGKVGISLGYPLKKGSILRGRGEFERRYGAGKYSLQRCARV